MGRWLAIFGAVVAAVLALWWRGSEVVAGGPVSAVEGRDPASPSEPPGPSILVRAELGDGTPVQGVRVRLREGNKTNAQAVTGPDGEVRFDAPLRGGDWNLLLSPIGRLQVEPRRVPIAAGEDRVVVVALRPRPADEPAPGVDRAGSIQGELTLTLLGPPQLPQEGWRAEWFEENGSGWAQSGGPAEFVAGAPPRVRFLLPKDARGPWRLTLSREDGLWFASASLPRLSLLEDGTHPHVNLLVQPRAFLDVVVKTHCEGAAVVHATPLTEAAAAWLSLGAPQNGRPEGGIDQLVDGEGRASLGPLTPGPWLLWVETADQRSLPRRADAPPGERLEVWLDAPLQDSAGKS